MFTKPVGFEKEYDEMCAQVQALDRNSVTLFTEDRLPLNYTCNLATTDSSFLSKFQNYIDEMRQTDPALYWYTIDKVHCTILGLIPLVGKELPEIGEQYSATDDEILKERGRVINTLTEILSNYPNEIIMRVCGSCTSQKVASVLCYPVNIDLAKLRTELRNALGIDGKKYIPTIEKIAWVTFAKYSHIPSEAFTDRLKAGTEMVFGEVAFKVHLRQNASSTLSDNEVSDSFVVHEF